MNKNRGNFAKRILVTALTLSLIGGSVDLSGFTVSAQTTQEEMTQEEATPGKAAQGESAQGKAAQGGTAQEKQTTTVTVTGFAELPENIREQQLPVGAAESDIRLPQSLTVTVEKTVMEDKDETDEEQSGTKGDSASQKENGTAGNTGSGEQGGTEGSTGLEGQGTAEGTGSGEQGESEGSTGSEGQGAAGGTGSGEQGGTEGSTGSEGQGMTGEAGNAAGEQGTAGQDNAAPENGNNSTDNGQAAGEQDSSGEGLVGRIADWFFAPMTVHAAENPAGEAAKADAEETTGSGDTSGTTEEVSLAGISWELNQDESDAAEFDASEASNGFCYVYTPVLPDTDKDGNTLAVGNDVELPAIYVLVGEPQLALLAGEAVIEVNGISYASVDEAIEKNGNGGMNDCTIKLLQNVTLETPLSLYGTITLDLNGHTLTNGYSGNGNAYLLNAKSAAGLKRSCNLTIKSSTAGGKILTDRGYGPGTLNVGSSASCTIERDVTIEDKTPVSIENSGTLTVKEGATLLNNNQYTTGVVLQNNSGNAILEGGSYTGDKNIKVKDGTLTINGGTYKDTINVLGSGTLVISGGTFHKQIILPSGRSLQDCMKEGYTLKALSSSNTINMDANTLNVPAEAKEATLYFTRQPELSGDEASLLEGYAAGEAATLTVAAKSISGTITYQWYVKKTPAEGTGTTERLAGATSESYQIPTGLAAGSYQYYCVATCGSEHVTSKQVLFTVIKKNIKTIINGTVTKHGYIQQAFDEMQEAINKAADDASVNITLEIGEDITDADLACTLNGTGKKVRLFINLNGKTVKYTDGSFIDTSKVQLTVKNVDVTISGEGTLYAKLTMQEKSDFTVNDSITFSGNLDMESGTAKLSAGTWSQAYIQVKDGASCEITGGTYEQKGSIEVAGGGSLKVSGDANIDETLCIEHTVTTDGVKRAEVALSGGSYKSIEVQPAELDMLYLMRKSYQCAIADMLASGYAFYDKNTNEVVTTLSRTSRKLTGVTVKQGTMPSVDPTKAVVKFNITKTDGTVEEKYFWSWEEAICELRDSGNAAEYKDWKKVEILLLKDAFVNGNAEQMVPSDKLPAELVLRSGDGHIYTLSGTGNGGIDIALYTNGQNLTVENIKTSGASIKAVGGTVTIGDGASLAASGNTAGGTIDVTESTLILEDGARVSSTNTAEDNQIAIQMRGATGTLRIKKGAQITAGMVYIYGIDNKSTVVIEEGAELSAISSATGTDACVYCNLDSTAPKVWNAMSSGNVYFLIDCNGVTLENSSNITQYEEKIYGRFDYESGTYGSNTKIKVPDTVCSYELTDGTKIAVGADHTFQMPSAKVKLLTHNPYASGSCPNCSKTDLAKAYKAGKLQINGLTGRTYDSWPQTLTGITLTGTDGNKTTLKGPSYISGKELAQDSTDTANAELTNADYVLVYENNINAYDKKQGESGFDEAKAPKVTITGQGNYTGTIEYYFTIGQGELLTKDFKVIDNLTYNGKPQKVLQYGTLAYEPDGTDADTPIKQAGQSGADASISVCTGKTVDTNGFASVAVPKIAYSTDNGSNWTEIDENATDESRRNNYWITDAGSYDFQIRATDGENAVSAAQPLTATIQPKSLTSNDISLDNSQSITAYYTGKPIIPTNKDHSITENYGQNTLEKGKDFTTSATNNTDVGDATATLTFNGIGNYTGTLTDTFSIVYAFELAQTTASADHWYNTDVPAVFGVNDTTGDTADALKQLIYRSVARIDNTYNPELSDDVKLYTTLEDAIANNTNAGYTFTGEGKQTVTLYGRDTARGYIANPIGITVKIDKTAPTWADEDGNTENYGIQIRSNWWRTLLNKVSFGILYNGATLDMKIHANDKKNGVDEVSGIDKYCYYIDTIADATDGMAVKTKTELDELAGQGKFQSANPDSGIFSGEGATISDALSNSKNYVIYAYAVDKAGNKSDYICTEGLVVDNQAPVLTVTAPTQKEGTLKDDEATIMIQSDEAAELVYFYQSLSDESKQLSYVEAVNAYIKSKENQGSRLPFANNVDGKWVSGVEVGEHNPVKVTDEVTGFLPLYCVELKEGQNSITLGGLNKAQRADVWMVAIDKAGNITDVKTLNFTTTKAMPRITTLPRLSGVYGDIPTDLKVTGGVAMYDDREISGTWNVESTDTTKPEVGTTKQYTVKFTPDATIYRDTYETAYVKVTPTIVKRPIRIKVADMTKVYKDSMPEIAFDIPSSNIGKVQLADGDTKETIKSSLQLVTEATADSEVGTYSFTVTSDSQNYEVTTYYVENLSDLVTTLKRQGTLTITQAAGELTKGTDYTDTKTVTYGDAPFSLNVTANHTESSIQYQVTEEKDADGIAIGAGDGHILSVSADGKVTINGAGSAKIQISLPASKNYTAPAALTVTVTAARKDFTVPEQSRSYLYDRDSSDTIDLAVLLPQDCGKAAYTISKTDTIFETAEVKDGKLSYKVKSGTIGTSGEMKVAVTTDNYTINGNTGTIGQITVKAELVDRKPVEPKTTVSVKTPTLTYGEPVSKLQFNSVTFVEQGTDKTVAGTLKWDTPDAVLDAGAQSVTWTFTPKNDEYKTVTGSLSITVERAVPKVTKAPVPGAYVYHPSNTLASDKAKAVLNAGAKVQGVVTDAQGRTVAGSWSWKEKEKPNAGTHTYTAVFTPTNVANYETVEKPVTLTVEKAYVSIKDEIESLHLPDYVHGEYLYNHELPIGFAHYAGKGGDYGDVDKTITEVRGRYVWAAPETQVKYTDGYPAFTGYKAQYELEFIPDDTTNYAGTMETKNGWSSQKMAWVFVYKADNPPYRPGAQMTVAHTCQKVSDVKLPKDWKWSGNDGDKSLEDNQAVSAQAEYTGSDADCYKNILCSITITRSDCDHAQTEVRNAKAATCNSEGSTGETWCKVCGEKLDDGCVLVKDATKHERLTETVVRQATTSQTGLKVQECSDCHYRKEVTIPKLSGGSTSQGGGSTQQPEATDGNEQNTAGGSSDGSGGSSTSGGNDGGQSTTTIQDGAKSQTKEQQPAQTPEEPANTNRNRTERKTDDTKPESGKPFIKGENGKEGWDVIHDELEAAGEGETVSVDMNGATTVPGEILGNISGKDITLVLDMGGGITWSINGKSFTKANPGDIDFGVTYGKQAGKTIPVDVINNVTGERYSINLTLAYDGEFGFSAVLSINMDSSNAGLYANLFYYNPESGELEFMCAGQIGEDGSVNLTFTHASDYTIVIDTEPMNLADASDAVETEDAVPNQEAEDADAMTEAAQDKTDKNNGWMFLLAAIAAAAVATGVVVLQKRRKTSAK